MKVCLFKYLPSHFNLSSFSLIGRIEPVGFVVKNDQTGLGKSNQDFRMIETTVSQRRFLDSERMRNETEEQRKARQVSPSSFRVILIIAH